MSKYKVISMRGVYHDSLIIDVFYPSNLQYIIIYHKLLEEIKDYVDFRYARLGFDNVIAERLQLDYNK
ncbi:MAG: hypothetical protein QM793_12695 [Muricomes sp.]